MKILNVGNRVMNTFVYKAPCGYVMIDTGYEGSFKSVEKKLRDSGMSFEDISYVFLTHAHDDHAGFLNELLSKTTKLKVIASSKAKPTLKRGQNSFEGGCSNFLALFFCKVMALLGKGEHRFPGVEDKYFRRFIEITDDNISEIEKLLGGKILFTPGHTSDSVSLQTDDVIFCGDAAMNGLPSLNRITIWIENKADFEKSWDGLTESNAKKIYPAHGKPFPVKNLEKYKHKISKRKLYMLK